MIDKYSCGIEALSSRTIPLLLDYWYNSSPQYLYDLGVDINLLPVREEFQNSLEQQIKTSYHNKKGMALIWKIDESPIGHNNVNQILFGERAFMHLHIWHPEKRKKGLGYELLKLSIPKFFFALELKELYCEPNAYNPAPNKILEKLGFKFIKKHKIIPGQINYEQEVNRWFLKKKDINFL